MCVLFSLAVDHVRPPSFPAVPFALFVSKIIEFALNGRGGLLAQVIDHGTLALHDAAKIGKGIKTLVDTYGRQTDWIVDSITIYTEVAMVVPPHLAEPVADSLMADLDVV